MKITDVLVKDIRFPNSHNLDGSDAMIPDPGAANEILAILLLAAKFDIPVCPHARGAGLCEYVQHLLMIDFIALSASMEKRIIEYVDHLHEYSIDPLVIKNGIIYRRRYPGYSITIKPETLQDDHFLFGKIWKS